jgi:hypothetical protein
VDPKALDRARRAAARAVRDAETIAHALGDSSTLSKRRSRRLILKLQNALVEVKKHHAITRADERRLTQLAENEPLETQRAIVEAMSTAVTRLHTAVLNAQWNVLVHAAQAPAGGAVAKARDALARLRARAAQAEALSDAALARRHAGLFARLDREMTRAKACVAVTIADEKRFRAATSHDEPDRWWSQRMLPPDAETMTRVLSAQHAAVEDLMRQLGAANDVVEGVRRRARIAEARARLGK